MVERRYQENEQGVGDMEDGCWKKGKMNVGFGCKVMLGTLYLAVALGLGVAVHTPGSIVADIPDNETHKSSLSQKCLVDPFTLKIMVPVTQDRAGTDVAISDNVIIAPSIRIPDRPALRTPVRPPFVHR